MNPPARKTKTLRAPVDTLAQAERVLTEAGWTTEKFFVACLALVADQPQSLLPLLLSYKPEERPAGRPRTRADREP